MKCLVTGAAGFIGSHLCERLISDGHNVIGVDDLSSGREENLKEVLGDWNFDFYGRSLIGFLSTENLAGFDCVFHLAAKADLIPSIEQPIEYFNANVTSTLHLLEACRRDGVGHLVFAGSSSVYGDNPEIPTKESSPLNPVHPYALTKFMAENLIVQWNLIYNVPFTILRLFNVYGPRHRTTGAYGGVFGTFMAQLANEKPLTIVGDGDQSRDFVHVRDVVDAFVRAADRPREMVINIGSNFPQSVNKLSCLLGAREKIHIPDRPGEPRITCADINRARSVLGWRPRTTFLEGVTEMRELISAYKDAPVWTKETIERETKSWFETLGSPM